jgi:predicted KAP-like P-loop ATPase
LAIAELIRSGEAGGKMIGVEGGWGAGKTTVINLLRGELSDDKLVRIAIFDAWAHEGDPLRRTYLDP